MNKLQVQSCLLCSIFMIGSTGVQGADGSSVAIPKAKSSPSVSIPLDFKGVVIGASSTPDQILKKLGVVCGEGADEAQICNGPITFAGEIGKLNLVIGKTKVVERIQMELPSESFEMVSLLLINKFGPPIKTDRAVVQNRMGAVFEQVRYQWEGPKGVRLTYLKYDGNLDISDLYFSTKNDRQLRERIESDNVMRRVEDM